MSLKRESPIESAFQIVIFFLMDFWQSFLKEKMLAKGLIMKDGLNPHELKIASQEEIYINSVLSGNEFVFCTVCGDPAGPSEYFEKIVEKRMLIPAAEQHQGITIKEDILFQLTIDFCNYFKTQFEEYGEEHSRKGSLDFAIAWLEDMQATLENTRKSGVFGRKLLHMCFLLVISTSFFNNALSGELLQL